MKSSLEEIKTKIAGVAGMQEAEKVELMGLVDKLYDELDGLAQTDRERADSVDGLAHATADEFVKPESNPEELNNAVKGLSESVDELEVSHPKLVGIVNRICMMFSDIGI